MLKNLIKEREGEVFKEEESKRNEGKGSIT